MAQIVPQLIAGRTAIERLWNAIRIRIAQVVFTSYKGTITGNGSTTSFTVTHGMNSRDVFVQIIDKSNYSTIIVDVIRPDNNTVTITFGTAPTSSQSFEVLIIKGPDGEEVDITNGNSETF